MSKKYSNKTAVCTYSAIVLSAASFFIQFAYEGWAMRWLEPLLTPLGIAGLILFVGAIGVFIWNLRREELTHEQWLEIRDRRQPDLVRIKDVVGEYIRYTFWLIKPANNPALYNFESYYTAGNVPSISKLLHDIVLSGNSLYLRIKSDEPKLGDIRTELENLASRLGSDKLDKMILELYHREHIARSYQIYLKMRRTHYYNAPQIENRISRSDTIGALARFLRRIYNYVHIMERGGDLE